MHIYLVGLQGKIWSDRSSRAYFVHTSRELSGETACIAGSILGNKYQNLSCWLKLYIVQTSLLEIHGYIHQTSGSVVVDSF